jgi:GNAT superfamily N-acetyltransferase
MKTTGESMEWEKDGVILSTDRGRLDREAIHDFLKGSYWARGIPRNVLDRSVDNALCFGLYEGSSQIGFARVITDYATFAYLSDVYVLESHRGRGLATWMMEVVMAHPELQGLRRWMLATRDAHGLYRRIGFADLAHPEWLMEISARGLYEKEP